MNVTLCTNRNRTIVYSQKCPDCGHRELTRNDFELSAYDPMRVVYGPGSSIHDRSYGPSYGPVAPEPLKQPDEFWSQVHCDACKRKFDPSIIKDGSEVVRDSAHDQYEKALEAWRSSR